MDRPLVGSTVKESVGFCAGLIALLCVVPCGLLVLFNWLNQPPGSAHNPPLYPDAQQITIEHGSNPVGNTQTIEYASAAPSNAIAEFYKNTLFRDRWIFDANLSSAHHLWFGWQNGLTKNISAYEMQVIMTETTHLTNVEIFLTEEGVGGY